MAEEQVAPPVLDPANLASLLPVSGGGKFVLPDGTEIERLPDVRTIQDRMVAILTELPAIGKDAYNEQQRFHYRSHDDVLNALNPLLARHGVFLLPRVLERVTGERLTGNNKTMYEVNLLVEFTFHGAGGDSLVASAWGEGTDMGDKSTNKAMTMAFKNVLAQAFAVSTAETMDSDGGAPEQTVRPGTAPQARTERAQTAPAARRGTPPASALLPDAISGEGALSRIMEALAGLDPTVDWAATIQPAVYTMWGVTSVRDLGEHYAEFLHRLSNAEVKLRETGDPGAMPPPNAAAILPGLAWAFDGNITEIVYKADGLTEEEAAAAEEAAMAASADPDEPREEAPREHRDPTD